MIYELVYVDPSIKRSDMYQTTTKGQVAVNLDWLSPENDPVSPKTRRLTERQQDTLIRMYKDEQVPQSTGMYITQAANQNNFYKRLQARRLVHLVECTEGYRGVHCMKWQLTEMGRTIASGLLDLPF